MCEALKLPTITLLASICDFRFHVAFFIIKYGSTLFYEYMFRFIIASWLFFSLISDKWLSLSLLINLGWSLFYEMIDYLCLPVSLYHLLVWRFECDLPYWLIYLNTWFLVDRTVLGRISRYVIVRGGVSTTTGLWHFKNPHQAQYSSAFNLWVRCKFSATASETGLLSCCLLPYMMAMDSPSEI